MMVSAMKTFLVLCLFIISVQCQDTEQSSRNQKLFFVSSSSTTSTLTTTTICFSTAATFAQCGKRRKREQNIFSDLNEDLSPTQVLKSNDMESSDDADDSLLSGQTEEVQRDGRFLLYWMTTTSTSTSTLATLECTPAGYAVSQCG